MEVSDGWVLTEVEPPPPEEQARLVRARQTAAGTQLIEKETWFVLVKRWWDAWRSHTGYDQASDAMDVDEAQSGGYTVLRSQRPGPIDNGELLASPTADGQLRRGIQEYSDFVLLPETVWKVLFEWYGGGPPLPRCVVGVGAGSARELRIELFPLRLKLCRSDEQGQLSDWNDRAVFAPRGGLVQALTETACRAFDLYEGAYSESEARVWHFKGPDEEEGDAKAFDGWALLQSTTRSLEELGLKDGDLVMLETARKVECKGYPPTKTEWPFFHRCRLDYKRRTFKDPADPAMTLVEGDRIDAGDGVSWYPATVVGGDQSRVLVQFHFREKPKKKLPPLLTEGGMFTEKQFTPKAKAGLEAVFKRYSTGPPPDGKLERSGLKGLLSCATNMLVHEQDPLVSNLLNQHGDGTAVGLDGFLKYWHTKAINKNVYLEDELTRLFERVGAMTMELTEDEKLLEEGKEWISRSSDRLGIFRTHDYSWFVSREKNGWRDFRLRDSIDAKLDGAWKAAEVNEVNWEEMAVLVGEKSSGFSSSYSSYSNRESEWFPMESARLAEFETKSLEPDEEATPLLTRTQSGGGVCPRPGAAGLQNLGNTCFMNATLQCLSNCGPLRVYFAGSPAVPPAFTSSLSSSPLSMNGRLAREFGDLLRSLWANTHTYCVPSNLKYLIGQKRPEFSGYQQQDAQELLTFMLDGLHEDVNRAPYPRPNLPDVEANGRPDSEVAREAWSQYLRRNDSRIVELFQFQIRSEVTCPVCSNVSVTFDPIMYLTLPVPKPPHSIHLTIVPLAYPRQPMRTVDVLIAKGATFGELEARVVEQLGLRLDGSTQLVFTDVWSDRIDRVFEHTARTSDIRTSDVLYAYEVRIPAAARQPNAVKAYVPVLFKRPAKTSTYYASDERCAPPRLLCIAKDVSTNAEVAEQMLAFGKDLLALAGESAAAAAANNQNGGADGTASAAANVNNPQEFPLYDTDMPQAGAAAAAAPAAPAEPEAVIELLASEREDQSRVTRDATVFAWEVSTYSTYMNRSIAVYFKGADAVQGLPGCLPEAVVEKGEGAASTSTTLHSCLLKNAEREQLSEEDAVYCRKCKEHRRCWKKIELWNLPSQLIIILKRFGRDRLDGPLTKIETPVEFPVELDVRDYVAQQLGDASYELYGVVNHHGSLGGGHYTAHAFVTTASDDGSEPRPDGEWFNFNDSSACQASAKDLDYRAGYILFYRRRPRQP